jgi:hypothetical protein
MVTALALIPVADGLVSVLHGNGHAHCPIHASPGILAEAYAAPGLAPAEIESQAGCSRLSTVWPRSIFVPPRNS